MQPADLFNEVGFLFKGSPERISSLEQTKFALLPLREALNKLNFVRRASGFNVHLRHYSAECQRSMYISDICLLREIKENISCFNEKQCVLSKRGFRNEFGMMLRVMLNLFQHPRLLSVAEAPKRVRSFRLRSMSNFDCAQQPFCFKMENKVVL